MIGEPVLILLVEDNDDHAFVHRTDRNFFVFDTVEAGHHHNSYNFV